MSEFANISGALDSHLNSMAGLPPVAWENQNYSPTQGTLYLRPTIIPGDTLQAGLGDAGIDEHIGLYQVDVFAEAGVGKGAAVVMADTVADQFSRGTVLSLNGVDVRIVSTSRGVGTVDGGWFIVPVTVSYQSFTQPR